MKKGWQKVNIPRVTYTCCGINYDSLSADSSDFFKCFVHKSEKKKMFDFFGNEFDVNFCITVWLVCKNNNCVTSFTYFYDFNNNLRLKIKKRGIKYILSLKDKCLEKLVIKLPEIPNYSNSKKYLWRYTDCNLRKKNVSNIYTLDDKKVGETNEQKVTVYKI